MIRRGGNSQGAALTEQLGALLVGSVLVSSLYGFFRSELFHLTTQETRTAILQDARGALDIIVRDLKNAGSWGTGTAPPEMGGSDDPNNDADTVCNRVYAASESLIHVQMDLNGNDNCSDTDPRENVKYELAGPTAVCPGPAVIRRNGDCLVAGVTTAPAGKLFTFFDENGADLGGNPPLSAIKGIRIAFSIQVKHPDPKLGGNLVSTVSTRIQLRN
jgi:Tfp pilus assembly protein PilW